MPSKVRAGVPSTSLGCIGAKATFQSIKALVNASGYLSQDEGVPSGSHLGIQVEQRLRLSRRLRRVADVAEKRTDDVQFQVHVLFFTMELGDLKHWCDIFCIDALLG